ncbi:exported hypothetical protein [Candidatus Zixiibacteriota bacterium]|nr:exported hypothetical protein [candidate division Zixibacteria bacterium]
MRDKRKLFVLSIFLLFHLYSPAGASDNKTGFQILTGIGYDFVSQRYFIDSVGVSGPDSILNSTLLKKDYLDDKKGLLYLRYDPRKNGRAFFEAGWEQTPEIYRALGNGRLVTEKGADRMELDGRFEIKKRFKGTEEVGEGLGIANARIGYIRRLNDILRGKIRIYGETVHFDSTGYAIFDYRRYGGEIGIDALTRDFNNIYMTVGGERREVPDSTALGYWLGRGIVGFMGGLGQGQLMAEFGLESRKYPQANSASDYLLYSLYSEGKIYLGKKDFLRPRLDLEYFNYRGDQAINDDYLLGRGALTAGPEFEKATLGVGPAVEILWINSEFHTDNYLEYGLEANFDYYLGNKALVLLSNQFGYRNYSDSGSFYSDFNFVRFNLIGNVKFWRALTFDLLLSAEREWHKVESDNTTLYLLSTNLIYTF